MPLETPHALGRDSNHNGGVRDFTFAEKLLSVVWGPWSSSQDVVAPPFYALCLLPDKSPLLLARSRPPRPQWGVGAGHAGFRDKFPAGDRTTSSIDRTCIPSERRITYVSGEGFGGGLAG